jgi:ABC-type multidrug transport system ATPase subunit
MAHRDPPQPDGEAVWLRRVGVSRGGQRLLDGVELRVRRGEAVVVAGENGAGKTTLLRVVAGLMRISEGGGAVLGDPLPVSSATRRRISAALDEPAFWPWMSAQAVVRTVVDLSGHRRPDVPALLAEMGLDAPRLAVRRSKRVATFSQGMRKRLQVACALAIPADLLLVDEPTASLDAEGAGLVWSALGRRRERGTTIVVASHDRDAAARLGARRLLLERGRVVARPAPAAAAAPS